MTDRAACGKLDQAEALGRATVNNAGIPDAQRAHK